MRKRVRVIWMQVKDLNINGECGWGYIYWRWEMWILVMVLVVINWFILGKLENFYVVYFVYLCL